MNQFSKERNCERQEKKLVPHNLPVRSHVLWIPTKKKLSKTLEFRKDKGRTMAEEKGMKLVQRTHFFGMCMKCFDFANGGIRVTSEFEDQHLCEDLNHMNIDCLDAAIKMLQEKRASVASSKMQSSKPNDSQPTKPSPSNSSQNMNPSLKFSKLPKLTEIPELPKKSNKLLDQSLD